MHFTITSATSTDVVTLGRTREAVRDLLGEHRTFRRTPDSEEADHFVRAGAIATYSQDGELVLLELHDPATVDLKGVQLPGADLDDLRPRLEEEGLELIPDDAGATIPGAEVGLYAPGGTVEGVSIGSG